MQETENEWLFDQVETPRNENNESIYATDYTHQEDNMTDKQKKKATSLLKIEKLKWWTTDRELEKLLSPYGKIVNVRFEEDKTNGRSKGIAYVVFEKDSSCDKAAKALKE
eukprot:TRINITY_DN1069_c0_g1_i1.p1 TRINITY_DN1069_c0_g1~~TRINITY_DN1069_c0_g1_i1.p1  ORF type:complete len:110 (+),score=31.06 TRINITY_DN1069_c0_g1_i1:21-350(+)